MALIVIGSAACAGPVKTTPGMALVPGGPAIVGDAGKFSLDGPKPVNVEAFWIDRFEVSNADYLAFTRATGRAEPAFADDPAFNAPDQPVTGVTWHDARAYCRWAGKRLPGEVEWEKAARGANGRTFPWGDEPRFENAHIDGEAPLSVFSKPMDSSPYGVRGMAGNVSEWMAEKNPVAVSCRPGGKHGLGHGPGAQRICAIIKGNNWSSALPHMTKAAHYLWDYTDSVAEFVGFRCARSASKP